MIYLMTTGAITNYEHRTIACEGGEHVEAGNR